MEVGILKESSRVYETESWGFDDVPFLNQMVCVLTELAPHDLMAKILDLEARLGRTRNEDEEGYSARIIDIDIIFYADMVIDDSLLKIPHRLMHERKFILEPLMDIRPDLLHPVLNRSIRELLAECSDKLKVKGQSEDV
jgi:2-amino-4-hydroxy-6-hydroxymethyldihydropteridine diphosphokinase